MKDTNKINKPVSGVCNELPILYSVMPAAGISKASPFTKNTSDFAPVATNGKFSGRIEGCVVGVSCLFDVPAPRPHYCGLCSGLK